MTRQAQKFISKKIGILRREGYPQQQAIAIAHSMARQVGFDVPAPNPAEVVSMVAAREWQKLPYFKQRRILEFVEGYVDQHGFDFDRLIPALIHMFDLDEEVAVRAIVEYRKTTKPRLRRNPVDRPIEIYGDILAIEAIKGNKSLWPNEKFRHDFKSGSKIYGLPDGSILIKSTNGKKLWKMFDYTEEDL